MSSGQGPSFADIHLATAVGVAAIGAAYTQSYADHNPIGAHGVPGYGGITYADMTAAGVVSRNLFVRKRHKYGWDI
jgi:hypothetical protein